MIIQRAYKTELDPNNKQRAMMGRCCGASRYVYNWGLAEWKRWYEDGKKPSHYKLCVHFNSVKDEICPWIREIPYAVTESAFRNLGNAFRHFFRRVKAIENPGYPKYKKRRDSGSFQLRNARIETSRVRLTGIGWVKLKERAYLPTTMSGLRFGTYATISERAGRWYISVQVEEKIPDPQSDSTLVIGMDFGLKALAVCSDGTVYENPKPLREAQKKLKRLQRELARRTKGGANWRKTKRKIARQYVRIANIRKHTQHQTSHDVVVNKHPMTVVIEDLNVSGMMSNHCLAQAISDVGFHELRRQIEYKAKWHGVEVVLANRWFPSSKTCSGCGCIRDDLTLNDRTFHCPDCGLEIDRDLNAARNLAAISQTAKYAGIACGVGQVAAHCEAGTEQLALLV